MHAVTVELQTEVAMLQEMTAGLGRRLDGLSATGGAATSDSERAQ